MTAVVRASALEPVVFIAVNSGTPPSKLAAYVRRHRITVPVVADVDRSLERACGVVPPISLQNIWQVRIITAQGQVVPGSARDLRAAVQQAALGARWNVDPRGIPGSLRSAWQAVETGNYQAAAKAIRRGLGSRKAEEKQAAQRLNDYVQQKIQEQLEAAQKALQQDRKWTAYRIYADVLKRFRGYGLSKDVRKQYQQLAKDPAVKTERALFKRLDGARRLLASARSRSRGLAALRRLIQQAPESEAAKEAQALLDRVSGGESAPVAP